MTAARFVDVVESASFDRKQKEFSQQCSSAFFTLTARDAGIAVGAMPLYFLNEVTFT
jgi:hypothetical protein